MKKLYITILLFLCGLTALAQDFEIVSVEYLPMDGTAINEKMTEPGNNGRECAVIRFATKNLTSAQRASFNFEPDWGSKVVQRADRNGEIWLWVSPGMQHLRIIGGELGQLEVHFMDYGVTIQSLKTYKIVIRGTVTVMPQQPQTSQTSPTPTMQFLAFEVTPKNATLEVNGELWSLDADGNASEYVDFGTYTYRVRAADYFAEEGTVTVNDPKNTVTKPVTLKPNFAQVTLKVDADAEIWVNNQLKGVRTWTGMLGSKSYKIECRMANHETSMTTLEITPKMDGQVITLTAPTPIYGSLLVESTPSKATIFIDGREVGTTPKSINEILIGPHEIRLAKEGYADYTTTVNLVKGETKQVKGTLSNGREIQFTCNVSNAQLEIDGQRVGSADGTYLLTYGNHSLRATAADYLDYSYTINVRENTNNHNIRMQRVSNNGPASSFSGKIMDNNNGTLPGATVVATHTPSGSQYYAVADANGNYRLNNIRPGGPYRLEISLEGYKTLAQEGVVCSAGENKILNVRLSKSEKKRKR